MMQIPGATLPTKDPRQHTTRPILTGTSVLAVKYADGVMMTSDTLASYGGLARFTNVVRLHPVGDNTLIGCSGDLSDFARVKETLNELIVEDFCEDDGDKVTAPEIHAFLSRVMYNKRNKNDPWWASLIVGGSKDGKSFLGLVDKLGMSFEGNFLSTGYGAHLALPILRNEWRPDMTEAEAKKLLDDCMRVLFYRDCRTLNKITAAKITAEGPATVSEPYVLSTVWNLKTFVKPKAGSESAGSW